MQISPKAEYLISKLNERGFSAYVVGGCVRDLLMGKTPGDWDITTSAKPDETLEVFCDFTTIPTGLQHGTVTVIYKGEPFEVTTFRTDGDYVDHRHPNEVEFVADLKEDLARRDFKMNAIAYSPCEGLIDPFCGLQDIAYKTISAVGDPAVRFEEDALRILRALRFAATLDFKIEVNTFEAATAKAPTLCKIAKERITTEFLKLICGASAERVLEEGEEILKFIFPCKINSRDVDSMPNNEVARLCAVFKNSPDNLKSLRLPKKTEMRVKNILGYTFKNIRYLVRDLKNDGEIYLLLNNCNKELVLEYKTIQNEGFGIENLQIDGQDLIQLGISGSKIGEILEELSNELCEEKIKNEREALLNRVKMLLVNDL